MAFNTGRGKKMLPHSSRSPRKWDNRRLQTNTNRIWRKNMHFNIFAPQLQSPEGVRWERICLCESYNHWIMSLVRSWCGIGTNNVQNTCGNIVFRFARGCKKVATIFISAEGRKTRQSAKSNVFQRYISANGASLCIIWNSLSAFRKYCLRWRGWLANGASSFQCLSKVAEQQSWAAGQGRVGTGKETSKGTLKAQREPLRLTWVMPERGLLAGVVGIALLFLSDSSDVG